MREQGLYWVLRKQERFSHLSNMWDIAEWRFGGWFLIGEDCHVEDNYFSKIDEKRVVRNA